MELSSDEQALCEAVGFQPFVAQLIKTEAQMPLRQLLGFDLEKNKVAPVMGLSVVLGPLHKPDFDKDAMASKLNEQLQLLGYRAFSSDAYEGEDVKFGHEVAVIKTTDSLDFVRLMATCGANFDISTDDLLDKLREWRNRFGLTITGAAADWAAFDFHSLPQDICRFAEEVYEFCPDSVHQGVGLMQEQDEPEFFREARELCGSVSDAMKQKILADFIPMDDEHFSEDEIAVMVEETEIGILLLANTIRTYGSLFLWWD